MRRVEECKGQKKWVRVWVGRHGYRNSKHRRRMTTDDTGIRGSVDRLMGCIERVRVRRCEVIICVGAGLERVCVN